jgi:hypothetical protein
MNFLMSRSIESALPGRSSTIFSGLAGGCTASDSGRFILFVRSAVGGISGCDQRLRFSLREFDRDVFSGFVFVSVEELSSAGSGDGNLLVFALVPFGTSGNAFEAARPTAERPPMPKDFLFSFFTEAAPDRLGDESLLLKV